jgi:hypothetical protein
MHLTVGQIYKPLAKSNGKILELTKSKRENASARWKRLHQFLSDIGVKALRTHLGQLLGIARISKTKEQYEGFFKAFSESSWGYSTKTRTTEPDYSLVDSRTIRAAAWFTSSRLFFWWAIATCAANLRFIDSGDLPSNNWVQAEQRCFLPCGTRCGASTFAMRRFYGSCARRFKAAEFQTTTTQGSHSLLNTISLFFEFYQDSLGVHAGDCIRGGA